MGYRKNKTNKYFIEPTVDFNNINITRKKMGLCPIEEYVKKWNIEL